MEQKVNKKAVKLAINRYFEQLKINKFDALPAMLLPGVGMIFVILLPPLVIANFLEDFNNKTLTLEAATPYVITFAVLWLVGEIIWRIAIFFLNRLDAKAMQNLYQNAVDELLVKDIGFFHNNFAGSLTKKALAYGRNFEIFADTITFNILANLIPIVFASIILWQYSPLLVFILIGMLSLIILMILPLIRKRQVFVREREQASNKMSGHLADVIGNIDAVQSYAHEVFETKNHNKIVKDYIGKAKKSWDYHNTNIDTKISPFYVLTNVLGLLFAINLNEGSANIGVIFITFSYFASSTRVLWEFNRTYRNLEGAITDAAQFTELMLDSPDVKNHKSKLKLNIPNGSIDFKSVNFKYKDSNEALFKNLNLSINAGEKVALVGHSGGGKTTITKLLLRFKEINSGQIIIDNQDISKYSLESLRKNIAYVPQEPIMFHRSMIDNIRYGKLEASMDDVIDAAKKANAYDFINKLSAGFDTLVGERGVKLSGGQRQRIAIARAMIKNAPILILDEATSALDSESEKSIQEALWELMQNRTAIVIAHRLSTVQKMDRIIVIDDGKIVEQGSHNELKTKNGLYAKLWNHQSGGFIK